MWKWIRRLWPVSKEEQWRRFLEGVDARNAQLYGGWPTVTKQFLGHLKLRSGTLFLGDPRQLPAVVLPRVQAAEVGIAARLRCYPSGMERLMALMLSLGEDTSAGSSRKIGELDIESTKLVVLDKADFEEHWTETNNSLDRACSLERAWSFIPIGDVGTPLMFVCGTGRGDGVYDVNCKYSENRPTILSIEFIEESALENDR